jgi:hypothetical protein
MSPAIAPPPVNTPIADQGGRINPLWSRYYVDLGQTITVDVAPADGPYWTSTANTALTNETNLGALSSGFVKITTGAGIATPSTTTTVSATTELSGTIQTAQFPATLPAISGVNLTNLNATNLASGTVPDARFPATLPVASGVNLTALNASNLGSGTVPDARFPATLPAASGINLTALKGTNVTHTVTTVNAAASPYTVLSTDEYLLANAVAGAITITLPTATAGRTLAIKKTDATGNAITLSGTVDGAVNPTLTVQNSSRVLVADGAAWQIVAGYL